MVLCGEIVSTEQSKMVLGSKIKLYNSVHICIYMENLANKSSPMYVDN